MHRGDVIDGAGGPALSMNDPSPGPVLETHLRPDFRVDPWTTLSALQHGRGDPTMRCLPHEIWRATRTTDGPATLRISRDGDGFLVTGWGSGADRAFAALPRLLGSQDEPARLRTEHPLIRALQSRFRGLRFGRTDAFLEALVPAILEQKVTGNEARAVYRGLIRRLGDRAPGPGGLWLLPPAHRMAAMPNHLYHQLGLEERRAIVLRRVAGEWPRLERLADLSPSAARSRLRALPGVGPWTAAEVTRAAMGDPDAVSVGDYHVPSLVAWALAGERRADDARMLELLEPFAGQRARVVRLLELGGVYPPRRGPRMPARSIRTI